MENNRRGSELFLGVIGVATLVVAIIGATFAYFSASTNSDEGAITATATELKLEYEDKINTALSTALIPSSEAVVNAGSISQTYITDADNTVCVDDNGNEICSIYEFTITNPNEDTAQNISVNLEVVTNTFTNLKYKIYDGTIKQQAESVNATATLLDTGATPVVTATTMGAEGTDTNIPALTQVLGANSSKTYTMVIWLNEAGAANNAEQGSSFAATLKVGSGDGTTGVTGTIAGAN